MTLKRPVLAGVTAAGRGGTLRLAATPVAGRPDEPFVVVAGATASAGVEWLAAPRTRRVEELRVTTAAPGDVPDLLSFDVLDMRLGSRLDYYPWVSKPGDVF